MTNSQINDVFYLMAHPFYKMRDTISQNLIKYSLFLIGNEVEIIHFIKFNILSVPDEISSICLLTKH